MFFSQRQSRWISLLATAMTLVAVAVMSLARESGAEIQLPDSSISAITGRVVDGGVLLTPAGASAVIPDDLPPVAGAKVSVGDAVLYSSGGV
jgi:hypothetical protein